eukprot:13783427-Alexandrium_andersonii.AAC.1
MRLPEERLSTVIKGKAIPASTYRAPTSAVALGPMRALRSAVADAVDHGAAANRSVEGALITAPIDLDPQLAVVLARFITFRRQWYKAPGLREAFQE